jgi:hypothetical protein
VNYKLQQMIEQATKTLEALERYLNRQH